VAKNPGKGRVCLSDMDPRQRGLMAAAWSFGLIAGAARGGINSVALGACTGPQGMIYGKSTLNQPWYDENDAAVYPDYHVVAGMSDINKESRLDTTSTMPTAVDTLAYQTGKGPTLWLANLTGLSQRVKITGFSSAARINILDEISFSNAAQSPSFLKTGGSTLEKVSSLDLNPYAVARISAI